MLDLPPVVVAWSCDLVPSRLVLLPLAPPPPAGVSSGPLLWARPGWYRLLVLSLDPKPSCDAACVGLSLDLF